MTQEQRKSILKDIQKDVKHVQSLVDSMLKCLQTYNDKNKKSNKNLENDVK